MTSNKAVLPKNKGTVAFVPPINNEKATNSKRSHRAEGNAANDQKRMKLSSHPDATCEKENEALAANATAPTVPAGSGIAPHQLPPAWFEPAMTKLMAPLQDQLIALFNRQYQMETKLMEVESLQRGESTRLYRMERSLNTVETQQTIDIIAKLNKMEPQTNKLSKKLEQVQNDQFSLSYRLSNAIAGQLNGGISKLSDPIYEAWNHKWEISPTFPSTVEALFQMNELEMKTFLEHYSILPVPPSSEEKLRTIQRFLGIPKIPL